MEAIKLYEFASQDQKEFVFVGARNPEQAVDIANKKVQEEGGVYIFGQSDIIPLNVKLDQRESVGSIEYLNFR